MPRDGSGHYAAPPGTDGAPDTTIDSAKYNLFVADLEQVLNTPAPIGGGGTGGGTVDEALNSLQAEKKSQIVANFDSMAWMSGSWSSAAGATNPPIPGHAFSGVVYVIDTDNITVEARDQDGTVRPGPLYIRQKKGGVWSSWVTETSGGGGPAGPAGPVGPIGPSGGVPGEKWFTGPANPTTVSGAINNDWYLNSTSGDYFELVSGTWTLRGNLMGPVGPAGVQGPIGPVGADGPVGPIGPVGPQGIPGPIGPTGATGTGAGNVTGPAGAVDGDIAIFDGTTGTIIKDGGKKVGDFVAKSGDAMTGTLSTSQHLVAAGVVEADGGFALGSSKTFATLGGGYTSIYSAGDNTNRILLADNTVGSINYFRSPNQFFQPLDGSANWLTINAGGISAGVPLTVNNNMTVNGNINCAGFQAAQNSNSVVRYNFLNQSNGSGAFTILDIYNDAGIVGEVGVLSSTNNAYSGPGSMVFLSTGKMGFYPTGNMEMHGPVIFSKFQNNFKFDGSGAGAWYDSYTIAQRFFVGTDAGTDTWRVYASGAANNVFSINGATGDTAIVGKFAVTGAITAGSGGISGGYYFGNTNTKSLTFDGSSYVLSGGPLVVNNYILAYNSALNTQGTYYFGATAAGYLTYDGTNFTLHGSGGSLSVAGGVNAPIIAGGNPGDMNTMFTNTPPNTFYYSGESTGATNAPVAGGWWNTINLRHSNPSVPGGVYGNQLSFGWAGNDNELYTRVVGGGNFSSWVRFLNQSNFGTYALPIAGGTLTGALTAPSLTVHGGLTVDNWGGNPGQGLIFYGNTGAVYQYWDGANYNFVGGGVSIGSGGSGTLYASTQTQALNDNSTKLASTAYVDRVAGKITPNCGRLAYASLTTINFRPYNGDDLKINGLFYKIPAGGLVAGNTSTYVNSGISNLAANTLYWVYAFLAGGNLAINFVNAVSGHTTSTAAGNVGVEIPANGDNANTLIGMVYTTAAAQFTDVLTLSWFNKRPRSFVTGVDNASTTSTTAVKLGTQSMDICSWAGEVTNATLLSQCYVPSGFAVIQVATDSPATYFINQTIIYQTAASPYPSGGSGVVAEGKHNWMISAYCGSSTNFNALNQMLQVVILG